MTKTSRAVCLNQIGMKETYLGDAVYASFDGWHIWLRTGDGNNQRIALEPNVLEALVEYNERIHSIIKAERQ